jgi:hypothetical protein
VLFVTLAILLTGCGESKQEQAAKSVCSARSDIKSRIATLQTLTPSLASLPQIKTEVTAIVDDLKRIQGAQGDLEPAQAAGPAGHENLRTAAQIRALQPDLELLPQRRRRTAGKRSQAAGDELYPSAAANSVQLIGGRGGSQC